MKERIKSYKGFDKSLCCRGFQYEIGKEYTHDGKVVPCESGFHACENPVACFGYYPPGTSIYHVVEQSGDMVTDGDKTCSSKIKIGAQIDVSGICKAAFEYVKSKCTNENNAEPGKPATAGEYGAATAGEYGAATAGNRGAATAGNAGAATAGEYGAATAGNAGAATSRGKSASGENGLSVARGNNVRVKGGIGAILVIAEENVENYNIREWKAAVVDGDRIKADTWYKLENGEFVECNE